MKNKLPQEMQSLQEMPTVKDEATALIAQAIDKGVDVATMEKLLAMRRELRAEKAKEAYDRAMTIFQSQCPTIQKTKEVRDYNGKVIYKYAPIESIVDQVKIQLRDNGFSYATSMEQIDTGVKVCVRVTHGMGHSEQTCMSVPLGNKTGVMSGSQQVAAAVTFAKRYAFCHAFGILTGDEDNDGAEIQHKELSRYQKTQKPYTQQNVVAVAPTTEDAVKETFESTMEKEDVPVISATREYDKMSIAALRIEVSTLMHKGLLPKDFATIGKMTKEDAIALIESANHKIGRVN